MSYFTNGEKWRFKYKAKRGDSQREILWITYNTLPSSPASLPDTHQHTTVEIQNLQLETIAFDNFLFLRPPIAAAAILPSDPLTRFETGYICCGPIHAGRLHVRGMLVKVYQPTDLHLGYNLLADVQLDRDRGVIEDPKVMGKHIYAIWAALLVDSDQTVVDRAVDMYVPLHLCDPEPIDVRESGGFMDHRVAELLMGGVLRHIGAKRAGDNAHSSRRFWLSSVDKHEENTIASMDYDVEPIPLRIYTTLHNLGVLWDAEEQQRRVISRSPESKKLLRTESNTPSSFATHTEHLVTVFRTMIDPTLCHAWKDAGATTDLDVYVAEDVVFFHDRNLDVQAAHPDGPTSSCPAYSSLAPTSEGFLDTSGVRCDCSAHLLADKLRLSTTVGRPPPFRDIAALVPRSFEVCTDAASSGVVTISWATLCEPRDARDFIVEMTTGTIANSPHHILYKPAVEMDIDSTTQGTIHYYPYAI